MIGLNALSPTDFNNTLLSFYNDYGDRSADIENTDTVSTRSIARIFTSQIISDTLMTGMSNSKLNVISPSFLTGFLMEYYDFKAIPYSAVEEVYNSSDTEAAAEEETSTVDVVA
jgi:hypothetical protein